MDALVCVSYKQKLQWTGAITHLELNVILKYIVVKQRGKNTEFGKDLLKMENGLKKSILFQLALGSSACCKFFVLELGYGQ